MCRCFLFFIIFAVSLQVSAETFEEGVKAYQDQKYEDASRIFYDLSEKTPNNPTILYNLGLSAYKQSRKGLALGLWRKAQSLEVRPEFGQAIGFVQDELGMGSDDGDYLTTGTHWISRQPIELWLTLSLVSTFLLGWLGVTYFAKRKLPLLSWPPGVFLLVPVWLLFCGLSLWQIFSLQETFGTIVFQDLSTRTSPSLGSPTLNALDEGERVEILKSHENWLQVRPLSGIPGWVPAEKVVLENES